MKTIIELMADVKRLQNDAANLYTELAKWKEQDDNQKTDVNITEIVREANHYPMDGHSLGSVKDAFVVEAYIILQFAIASKNVSANVLPHPMIYPCRIASSFSKMPDVELYFKKSLILDEATIHKYISIIKNYGLKDLFILDALIMATLYDKSNRAKLEFIADIATLLNCDVETLKELVAVAKSCAEHTSLIDQFEHISLSAEQLLTYLKMSPKATIKTTKAVLIYTKKQKIISTGDLVKVSLVPGWYNNLDEVCFINATFNESRWREVSLYFENVKNVMIKNCVFVGFECGVLRMNKIDCVQIINSEFNHCIKYGKGKIRCNTSSYQKCQGDIDLLAELPIQDCNFKLVSSGLIGELKNVKKINVVNTTFRCCSARYGQTKVGYSLTDLGEDIWYNKLFTGINHANLTAKDCCYIKSCTLT